MVFRDARNPGRRSFVERCYSRPVDSAVTNLPIKPLTGIPFSMPRATLSKPTRLSVVSFISAACLSTAACSSDSGDSGVTTGGAAPSGGIGAMPTGGGGGTGAVASGGTGAVSTGGQACAAPNPNGPADHATAGYDTQPCSACHASVYTGGFVYDPSGATTIAQATVTITPTGGVAQTAVTGSTGMFYFLGTIPAPYEVCVSKCPDTVCSTAADHPNAADCGTCHGVTTTKIHLP
jgi:hypothetical protein